MTLVALTLLALTSVVPEPTLPATTLPATGEATYYNPGVMQRVRVYRESLGQLPECPECISAVALLSKADIGRKVWIAPVGEPPTGPYLVVDCAAPQHVADLQERGWLIDVDYKTAQRWGMRGPITVTVWDKNAACDRARFQSPKRDLFTCNP